MLRKLLDKTIFRIKDNFAYYGISVAALFSGVIIAVVCAFSLPELSTKELSLYFEDFFSGFKESGADSGMIMLSVLKTNAITFCLLMLFSVMIIGTPFILLIGVWQGFAFGFAVYFIFKIYGIRALLIFISAILPHIIIAFPCSVMLLAFCLRFCLSLKKDRNNIRRRMVNFILNITGIYVAVLAVALLQAYIEPILIRLVAGYFI